MIPRGGARNKNLLTGRISLIFLRQIDILQKARLHAKDSLYRYGPDFFPVNQIINRQPAIAIDRGLWLHWNFRDRDGSDVTCSGCAGNGIEVGQVKWMQIVMTATHNLSKVYLLSNMSISEDLGGKDFTFKNDIDPPDFVVFSSYHWANSNYPISKNRLTAFRAKVKWLQFVEAEPKEVIDENDTIGEGDTEDLIAADITTGGVKCVDTVSKGVDGSQMP